MLKDFTSFLRGLKPQSRADREYAYLCGSTDRLELEYRQRQIDRGLFR